MFFSMPIVQCYVIADAPTCSTDVKLPAVHPYFPSCTYEKTDCVSRVCHHARSCRQVEAVSYFLSHMCRQLYSPHEKTRPSKKVGYLAQLGSTRVTLTIQSVNQSIIISTGECTYSRKSEQRIRNFLFPPSVCSSTFFPGTKGS